MANISKQMSLIFPVVIILFSLNFPQGLALYWVTGTLFMVVQQYLVVGWGGMRVPAWLPGAHRTTSLSYPKAAALTASRTLAKDGGSEAKQPAVAGDTAVSANGSKNPAAGAGTQGKPREPVRTGPSPNRSQSRQARARRKRRR